MICACELFWLIHIFSCSLHDSHYFFAVSMTALLQSRLLRAIGSMLQSQTTMVDTLQAESIAITSAFLLLFFVCGVALLQRHLLTMPGYP